MLKKISNKINSLPLGVKAGIWFVVLQYVQQAIVIIATPFFTRLMSTDEYGLVNIYNTWQSILNIILTLKLSASIYQLQMVEYKDDRDNLTSSLVTISTMIMAGASLAILLFSNAFSAIMQLPTNMIYIMLADIWAQMVLSFWLTRNKFEYEYKKCLTVVLSNCLLRTLFSIFLVYVSNTNQGYYKVVGNLIPEFVFTVVILFEIYRKGKKKFITSYWSEAIKFNIVIVPSYLSEILLSSSDRLMINTFCPRSDVALYSIAYSCAHLAQLFFAAINWVFTPYAYNCLDQNRFEDLRKTANALTVMMAALTGALVAFAPEAIAIFAPSSYHEAIWVIPPAACGIFLTFIYGFFTNTEYFHKKNVYITMATIIGALSNICLNWIFIPMFGYIAAAYTTVAGYVIMTFVHYVFYKKTIAGKEKMIYDIKTLFIITAILYVFSGVCLLLYEHLVIRYLIIFGILFVFYLKRKDLLDLFKMMRSHKQS